MRLYTSGRAIGSTGHSNWSVWQLWSLKTDSTIAKPSPTWFGDYKQIVNFIAKTMQIPQWTSCPGSSQMRMGSQQLPSKQHIGDLQLDEGRISSLNKMNEACWIIKYLSPQTPSLAYYHTNVELRWRNRDDACIAGAIVIERVKFYMLSCEKCNSCTKFATF
jgi:hypothetical protein